MKIFGWLVVVEIERLGGGDPAREIYAAGFMESGEAVAAVEKHIRALDEQVTAVREIKAKQESGIILGKGEIRQIITYMKD